MTRETSNLGQLIKDFIDARYMKIELLATGLGLSSDIVSRMLSGKRTISAIEYFGICKILEVKPSYFYDLMEKENAGIRK